ncbi:MAG: pyroglutamyl-peptidase I [Planctomycetota bacterium]|nr:MAG: pyroglutamyl-peptidase I [Planctomycetota bacterium]REK22220.1 MAG: pyroglutamyl-peptidase I [Planctomycetota bacterium]REK44258.1 MAG: pyroglutamyl-peptidase I [Planctomycetota bacterium]
MTSVLVTAFEPYDDWAENASWLTLIELTKALPEVPVVTTRRYPVDFEAMRLRLTDDLRDGYDYAIHLGQSPRDALITLEAVALNVRGERQVAPEDFGRLIDDGPAAFRTPLPVARLAERMRSTGLPVRVSYHAGEYLCNGVYYLSHYLADQLQVGTQALFLHLPIDPAQLEPRMVQQPTLPAAASACAIRLLVDELDQL